MTKQLNFTQTRFDAFKSTFGIFGMLIIALLFSGTAYAQNNLTTSTANQELTVTGTVSDEDGRLEGVSIIKKGTVIGTATDKNGAFTFPKPLKDGDILLFSYLGYETQEVKVEKDRTVINLVLTSDVIEVIGALQTDSPYKSKRK
ncbi:carboxypeptidase-like regulatory domain-containing protein [Pontimicrobium sp. MEBiC01747]